jgi:hypothetical protein
MKSKFLLSGSAVLFFALILNGWALLPGERHEGGCLPYALAYCASHPGCSLIIFVHDEPSTRVANALGAHVIVSDHGAYTDDLHTRPEHYTGVSPLGWIHHTGKLDLSWHIFRSIDFDHQTAEDRHVLEVLKKTAGA